MVSVEVSEKTVAMLAEATALKQMTPQIILENALTEYRRNKLQHENPLAPDGLPWPEGYFDTAPKINLEEAVQRYGLRPKKYFGGLPVYTSDQMEDPKFKMVIPPESPELEAQWQAEWMEYQENKHCAVELTRE